MKKQHTPVKVVVIGAGNMGRNHVRTYSNLDQAQLLALADINPETAAMAKQHGIRFYTDYRQMLDEERPDAVSIVVPTTLHHQVASEVIGRGIHCLVEKPIATTPKEGDELIALARKHKVIFTVGHIERFNPMIMKLKRLIEDKKLGEITSIVVKRVGGFPIVEPKTDVIIDLAVHDIDILSHLLSAHPKSIYGHGSKTLHSSKIDSAELLLDYGKASGFIQANWITPVKVRTIAVTGSEGYVEGNYITQELTYYKHNLRVVKDGFKNFVETLGDPEKHHITDTPQEPLANELKAFMQAIRQGDASGLVDPKDAREALKLALEALEPQKLA
jgi:UDP-N-acetylglucosamine 3-dehydrogenase